MLPHRPARCESLGRTPVRAGSRAFGEKLLALIVGDPHRAVHHELDGFC